MRIRLGEHDFTVINVSRFDADTMEPYDVESASAVGLPWDPEPGTMGVSDLSDGTLAKLDRDDLERITVHMGIATSSDQSDDDLRDAIAALRDKTSPPMAAGAGDGGGGASEAPSVEDPAAEPQSLKEMDRDALKALAKKLKLDIDGRSGDDEFRAAIQKAMDAK